MRRRFCNIYRFLAVVVGLFALCCVLQVRFVLKSKLSSELTIPLQNPVVKADNEEQGKGVPSLNNMQSLFGQQNIDYMAANMDVRLELLSARKTRITLFNRGKSPITRGSWAVYFCTWTVAPTTHILGERTIKMTHINGCLFKFEPVGQFKSILFGESLQFHVDAFSRARTDILPNWYVAASGLEPRTILNTIGEDLNFVSSPSKLTWDRYNALSVSDLGNAPLLVTPTPREIVRQNEIKSVSIVSSDWGVCGDKELENEINYLAGELGLKASSSRDERSRVVRLFLIPSDKAEESSLTTHEAYILHVNGSRDQISISGKGQAGVFYGIQTLLQLINDKGEVPQVSINDSPRYPYRGLMVDVGRNFIPKNEILKLLNAMATYKMNKFHFHLSENEGWRLQIPGLEELTDVGSKRCHDLKEKKCIMHQLGSGPNGGTFSNGYYTITDYKDILRYANERHIQVIPEFDIPGHSHAAIKSMIARHDRLTQEGRNVEAMKFLLNDFEDHSHYLSQQRFTDEAVNPCTNSTYTFISHLFSLLVSVHKDIQPLKLYFWGGDEVAAGAWKESPTCKQLLRDLNHNNSDTSQKRLMQYFIKKISQIAQSFELKMGGWSDAFFDQKGNVMPRDTYENKNVAYYWSKSGNVKRLSSLMGQGYKIVLTPPDYLYFDHPYEPDFEERGKYWAAPFIDSRKVFNYSPVHLSKNSIKENQQILGVEGCVWGETIRTADQMNSMLFPRLLALAERSWHKASWESIVDKVDRERESAKDWERFANTLAYRELGRLDKMGVAYRVPPPGVRIVDKQLKARTALPGLRVEYSTDDGITWNDVTEETEVDGKLLLRSRSVDQKRFSRLIAITNKSDKKEKTAVNSKTVQ